MKSLLGMGEQNKSAGLSPGRVVLSSTSQLWVSGAWGGALLSLPQDVPAPAFAGAGRVVLSSTSQLWVSVGAVRCAQSNCRKKARRRSRRGGPGTASGGRPRR